MLKHPVPAHRIAVLALTLLGCGDDTTSSNASANASDAGEQTSRPAAESGKSAAGARSAEKADAGQPAKPAQKDAAAPAKDTDKPELDAGEQAVKLRFRAQVGAATFACGNVYKDQGSTRQTITPRDLRLFIQDVVLLDESGRETPVKLDTRDPWQTPDVALLDFEDSTGECLGTPETNHEITGVVPKGQYTALRFSHGVPDKLNHADPKTFPAPLKTPGMTWNWLLGLRFVRFEMGTQGQADMDAGSDPGSFSLHVGSTGCAGNPNAGTITCGKPNRSQVELKNFDVDKSEIVLDVSDMLSGSDLSTTAECHSGTPNCEAMFNALGVDYATGKPAPNASAYRLE